MAMVDNNTSDKIHRKLHILFFVNGIATWQDSAQVLGNCPTDDQTRIGLVYVERDQCVAFIQNWDAK